jgi:hypothetical protein
MNKPISRRTLLRGAGASLALPWLEAMASDPGRSRGPVRMAAFYMPNGVHPDMWTPEGEGRRFELSPTLMPLAPFKDKITVLTNLWNAASVGGDGHYVKISGWLTSTTITKTLGVDVSVNGVSVDQVAAQRLGRWTPIPSLELATAPVSTGVDRNVGYTRVYGSHISWSGPTMPLAKEIDPALVFERLLGAARPADSAKSEKPLLDRVLSEARDLRSNLGPADRLRIDEYLSAIRSVEQRIERASDKGLANWRARASLTESMKPAEHKDYGELVQLMMDMVALAFQTDSTRIATLMYGNEVSNQNFSFVDGVTGGFHEISHHQKEDGKLRQYQIINRWHVAKFAYLCSRLDAMKEGESSVLDNSMLLLGGGIRDGNAHNPHNLPIVLAGLGGGRIDAGQHLVFEKDSPLANLYVSMLDAFGSPVERFADSTGPARGVLKS